MRILISSTKQMKETVSTFKHEELPLFLEDSKYLLKKIQALPIAEAKKLWKASEKITRENFTRLQNMELEENLLPAIFAYNGIQYKYMQPATFTQKGLTHLQEHVRILSGFYGILKPFDGITPYRLDMQTKIDLDGYASLYDFWGNRLYQEALSDSRILLNLASQEYAKSILPYVTKQDTLVTCIFGQLSGDKLIQKATYAKMARGEMVKFICEHQISSLEEIKDFHGLDFHYQAKLSTPTEYVFTKTP